MKKKKIIWITVGFLIALFLALESAVIIMQDAYSPEKSDCLLILGHSLEDGAAPGSWLVKRLEKGLDLYESGYADVIIVTGGKGPSDQAPVSVSMKAWLVARGVDETKIIVEDRARNTIENMLYTRDIMAETQLESVAVVTNDFHMFRAMHAAQQLIGDASGSAADVPLSAHKMLAYAKEPFSIVKYMFWHIIT